MDLEQAGIVPDMEQLKIFGRWAFKWPPSLGSGLFWAVVILLIPASMIFTAQGTMHYYQKAGEATPAVVKVHGPDGKPAERPSDGL